MYKYKSTFKENFFWTLFLGCDALWTRRRSEYKPRR